MGWRRRPRSPWPGHFLTPKGTVWMPRTGQGQGAISGERALVVLCAVPSAKGTPLTRRHPCGRVTPQGPAPGTSTGSLPTAPGLRGHTQPWMLVLLSSSRRPVNALLYSFLVAVDGRQDSTASESESITFVVLSVTGPRVSRNTFLGESCSTPKFSGERQRRQWGQVSAEG